MAGEELPASLRAEGSAMRRAIATDLASIRQVRVTMTLDERFYPEPGPWQTVRVSEGSEFQHLFELAPKADAILIIAPESGGLLEDREQIIRKAGGRSLGSTPEAVKLAANKFRTAAWLSERNIPTVPGILIAADGKWPDQRPSEAVLKPVDGAGSTETYYLDPESNWPLLMPPSSPMILQPYCKGTPASLAVIMTPGQLESPGSVELIGSSTQNMLLNAGKFSYRGGSVPAKIPEAMVAVLLKTLSEWRGLAGWVGIDLLLGPDPAQAMVLEVNPRLTTSYVGLRHWFPEGGTALASRLLLAAGIEIANIDRVSPRIQPTLIQFNASGEYSLHFA